MDNIDDNESMKCDHRKQLETAFDRLTDKHDLDRFSTEEVRDFLCRLLQQDNFARTPFDSEELLKLLYLLAQKVLNCRSKLADLFKILSIRLSPHGRLEVNTVEHAIYVADRAAKTRTHYITLQAFMVLLENCSHRSDDDQLYRHLNDVILNELEHMHATCTDFILLFDCCNRWLTISKRLLSLRVNEDDNAAISDEKNADRTGSPRFRRLSSDNCSCIFNSINFVINIVADNLGYTPNDLKYEIQNLMTATINLSHLLLVNDVRYNKLNNSAAPFEFNCRFLMKHDYILNTVISQMSWAVKRKYYILKVLFQYYRNIPISIDQIFYSYDIEEGLLTSLRDKHTVHAGLHLFRFCIDHVTFDRFIERIVNFISHCDNKTIAVHFVQHWFPPLCEKCPDFVAVTFESLTNDKQNSNRIRSYLLHCLVKKCRETGHSTDLIDMESFLNIDSYVRSFHEVGEEMSAIFFQTVCLSNRPSVFPSESEFRSIRIFLTAHVSTDNPVFRKTMLTSLEVFIVRLQCSVIKILKRTPLSASDDSKDALTPAITFLRSLNRLIINCLEPGSNYQCKIFALRSYEMIAAYVCCSQRHRLTGGTTPRKGSNKQTDEKRLFTEFVQRTVEPDFHSTVNCIALFRCLSDTCEEIREIAVKLLIDNFDAGCIDSYAVELYRNILNDSSTSSALFYRRDSAARVLFTLVMLLDKRESGRSANELITRATNGNGAGTGMNISDFLIGEIANRTELLKTDLFKSAITAPIDWLLAVLVFLTDRCEIWRSQVNYVERTVLVLEDIVPHLLDSLSTNQTTEYAPSFEDMGIALHNIVKHSQVEITDQGDDYQLNDAQQCLLNYTWTTLKNCCKLCVALVKISTCPDDAVSCLQIIVKILKLCRHKGAIEAAAVCLSDIVKIFTNTDEYCIHLQNVLSDVLHLISAYPSCAISRRSAGLSLLVRSIVASDSRKDKPLFAFCWSTLNTMLKNVTDEEIISSSKEELSEVHALHLLRALVADARLTENLAHYMEDVTILCLKLLSSRVWTIRNASLQLFGAIQLKLIGQKSGKAVRYNKLFEQVFDTMTDLFDYIIGQLNGAVAERNWSSGSILKHSNVVPILIILAGLNVSSFKFLKTSTKSKVIASRKCTGRLLGSRIFHVRNLAGKAYVNLHCHKEIPFLYRNFTRRAKKMIVGGSVDNNRLNGYLLALKYIRTTSATATKFREEKPTVLFQNGNVCPINWRLLHSLGISMISNATLVSRPTLHLANPIIGYDEYVELVVDLFFKANIDPSDLIEFLLSNYVNNKNGSYGKYVAIRALKALKSVISRLPKNEKTSRLLITLFKYSICSAPIVDRYLRKNIAKCSIAIFEILHKSNNDYTIDDLKQVINLNTIEKLGNGLELIFIAHFIVQFHRLNTTRTISSECDKDDDLTETLLLRIYPYFARTPAEVCNVNAGRLNFKLRMNIVNSLLVISEFSSSRIFLTKNRSPLWYTLIKLLQDDEPVVRYRTVKFVYNCFRHHRLLCSDLVYYASPSNCLMLLFEPDSLDNFFAYNTTATVGDGFDIGRWLFSIIFSNRYELPVTSNSTTVLNPFYTGSNAFYTEKIKLIHYVYLRLLNLENTKQLVSRLFKSFPLNVPSQIIPLPSLINCLFFDDAVYVEYLKISCLLSLLLHWKGVSVEGKRRLKTMLDILEETFRFSYYRRSIELCTDY